VSQEIQTKDLKVRLPMHYHMKLQTLKILKGKNMSVAFCEALDMYFAEKPPTTMEGLGPIVS
jgi:hypothetical protein